MHNGEQRVRRIISLQVSKRRVTYGQGATTKSYVKRNKLDEESQTFEQIALTRLENAGGGNATTPAPTPNRHNGVPRGTSTVELAGWIVGVVVR